MPSASERPSAPAPAPAPLEAAPPERPPLLEFDWLTEVAIPICIFGLLGSLLYYLIEVRATLAGQYSVGPLRWVVFWFLLACIGIARIRTKYGGAAIAGYYSALLAGAIMLFVWVYTGRAGAFYGADHGRGLALLFNWAVVGVVWWAANAVTREATLEENVEVQLDSGLWTLLAEEWQYPDQGDRSPAVEVDHAQVRPRHPGRLVLWVSLAALVLFALGQRTIGGEGEHARTAFWCMSLYVLFALLLLALTNLSALRMSVRRRGISLAPAITPAWIVAGLFTVVAIVLFATIMPRPSMMEGQPQYVRLPTWLQQGERPGIEEGPAEGLGRQGERPGGEAHSATSDERGPGEKKGAGGEEGESGRGGEQIGRSGEGAGGERGQGEGEGQGGQQSEPAQPRLEPPTAGLGWLLLWLLIIALVLVALYFLWAHRQALLAGLRTLARIPGYIGAALLALLARFAAWLGRLGLPTWSWRGAVNLPDDPFVDIFARGLDAQLPPAEVIRYVYRAFQVYAARGGHRRRDDQTALEFLHSLPPRLLLPDQAAERLTRAYVLATYSPHEVTPAQVRGAQQTWALMKERLESVGQMGNGGGSDR